MDGSCDCAGGPPEPMFWVDCTNGDDRRGKPARTPSQLGTLVGWYGMHRPALTHGFWTRASYRVESAISALFGILPSLRLAVVHIRRPLSNVRRFIATDPV